MILFHFLHRVGVKFGRKIPELWIVKNVIADKNFLDSQKFSPVRETNSFSRDSLNSKGINLFISDCVEEGRRMYEKGGGTISLPSRVFTLFFILNLFSLRTFHPILLLFFTPFYPTVDRRRRRRRRRRDASKSLPQLVDVDFHPMIKVSRLYIVMIKVRGFLRGS